MMKPLLRSLRRILLLAGPIVFLASCEVDILGPFNDTIYVLDTIDGAPLPATVTPEFGDLAWIVTADTIWLGSGSHWRRHSVQHREEGVGGDPLDYVTDGKVVWQEDVLILSFDCKDGDCIIPDRLIGDSTMLEMERTYMHDGRTLIFKRN